MTSRYTVLSLFTLLIIGGLFHQPASASMEARLDELQQRIAEHHATIAQLQGQIQELQRQAGTTPAVKSQIARLEAQVKQHQQSIDLLEEKRRALKEISLKRSSSLRRSGGGGTQGLGNNEASSSPEDSFESAYRAGGTGGRGGGGSRGGGGGGGAFGGSGASGSSSSFAGTSSGSSPSASGYGGSGGSASGSSLGGSFGASASGGPHRAADSIAAARLGTPAAVGRRLLQARAAAPQVDGAGGAEAAQADSAGAHLTTLAAGVPPEDMPAAGATLQVVPAVRPWARRAARAGDCQEVPQG